MTCLALRNLRKKRFSQKAPRERKVGLTSYAKGSARRLNPLCHPKREQRYSAIWTFQYGCCHSLSTNFVVFFGSNKRKKMAHTHMYKRRMIAATKKQISACMSTVPLVLLPGS